MGATMSLLGLWTANKGLFDFLKIPAALNKQTLIDNLLMECAELEILYPDAEFMREAIGAWSSVEVDKWEELEKTLHYDYDPIANYDRREEWTDDSEGSSTATSTATGKQAGYNSQELVTSDGSESGGSSSGTSKSKHIGTVSGNIGVTTTQQMIEEERRISVFDIDHVIIQEFKKEFCIMVY